jgi:ATP-dependent Clp protease protease subunit
MRNHSVALEEMTMLVPTVVQHTQRGERAFDIYSRLLEERIVFLGTEINDDVANVIIAQLLHLDAANPEADVRLYINSPGGDMNGLFAIHDTMSFLRADVSTICIGQAASAAAVLLAAGAPGKRFTLPNSRILIHQPHGGTQGQSVDIEIWTREFVSMRDRMVEILEHATGQDRARLLADIDRDYILRGEGAVEYGLVDHVIRRVDAAEELSASA